MKLLTVKETANSLKLSLSMVYRLISSGKLPSYAIGGCIRVNETDLEKFLDLHRNEATPIPTNVKRHF